MSRRTSILTVTAVATLLCACEPLLYAPLEEPRAPNQECAPPLSPEGLRVDVALDHVTLSWQVEPGTAADGYIVELRSFPEPTWGELGRVAAPPVDYGEPELPMLDAQHAFRVRAEISAGGGCSSAPSEEVVVTTLPRSPETAAAAAFADRIRLTWRDPNDFETGYLVERRDRLIGGSFHPLAGMPLPRNTEQFEDFELLDGDWRYDYKIYAVNSSGRSSAALVSQPVLVSTRAARPPEASWVGDPYFDAACQLVLPAHAEFDVELGAAYDDARSVASAGPSGTLVHVREDPAGSGDFYIEAQLASVVPGTIDSKWTVRDTLDGATEINRSLLISRVAVGLSRDRLPTRALGDDDMAGRQVLLPGCSECDGRRGSLATGSYHACVLTAQGGVRCWGANGSGQLGIGIGSTASNPLHVCDGAGAEPCAAPLRGVEDLTIGDDFMCARDTAGALRCWGETGYNGQLGAGREPDWRASAYPQPVCSSGATADGSCAPLTGVAAQAAGADHACALVDGVAHCWGDNSAGQLGRGIGSSVLNPTAVCAGGAEEPCLTTLSGATQVVAGGSFYCALVAGGVKCWGHNSRGQIGDGTFEDAPYPTDVCEQGSRTEGSCVPLSGVVAIDAGDQFVCAQLAGGELRCWGYNYHLQLGTALPAGATESPNPVPVCDVAAPDASNCAPLTGVERFSSGAYHSCALLADGRLVCWGDGDAGALGNGAEDAPVPLPVCSAGIWDGVACDDGGAPAPALAGVAAVSAGEDHSCAVMDDGGVYCWGGNYYYQLGRGGDDYSSHYTPRAVCANGSHEVGDCDPLSGASAVIAGPWRSCALVDGGARCWGENFWGELGDGTDVDHSNPTAVCAAGVWDGATCDDGGAPAPLGGVVGISLGRLHTCALLSSGEERCWGSYSYGRLGNGGDGDWGDGWSPIPEAVCATGAAPSCTPLSGVTAISAGSDSACAVVGGELRCWGDTGGSSGPSLGVDFASSVFNPTPVCGSGAGPGCVSLSGAQSVVSGLEHSCVLLDDGSVRCWGANDDGQLGAGDAEERSAVVGVCTEGSWQDSGCSGAALGGVSSLAAGFNHTCAVTSAGEVWCWGEGSLGQLGDHGSAQRVNAAPVCDAPATEGACAPLGGVVKVVAGHEHSCALSGDGRVLCWGNNEEGQLGDGGEEARDGAVEVCVSGSRDGGDCVALSGALDLAAGAYHACALLDGGAVRCWGYRRHGEVGDGTRGYYGSAARNPTAVCRTGSEETGDCAPLTGASAIFAGFYNSCALLGTGDPAELICWGDSADGQLGVGRPFHRYVPTEACASGAGYDCEPLRDVVALAAGVVHTCAVLADGSARCWGGGDLGQLANGFCENTDGLDNNGSPSPSPVLISGRTREATARPLTGVRTLAARGHNTCAVTAEGRAWCWGPNDLGQIGDGTIGGAECDVSGYYEFVPARVTATPVCVAGRGAGCFPLEGVLSVAVGGGYACALSEQGTLKCWGDNSVGQLGNGTQDHVLQLVDVCEYGWGAGCERLSDVRSVTLGARHSCALLADSTLRCWGSNAVGQLGDGTELDAALPQSVCASSAGGLCQRLGGAIALALADDVTCAVTEAGQVLCWGRNDCGQLGNGNRGSDCNLDQEEERSYELLPQPVCELAAGDDPCEESCGATLGQVEALVAGRGHLCALVEGGGVRCWGHDSSAQLGLGPDFDELASCGASDVCASGSGRGCVGGQAYAGAARRSCMLNQVLVP